MATPDEVATKEHGLLCKVLGCSTELNDADLAELVAELEGEGKPRRLNADIVERVLMAKLSVKPQLKEQLKYLKGVCDVCDQNKGNSKLPPPVLEQLPKVLQMSGNYTMLALCCAELFGGESLPPDQAGAVLAQAHEDKTLNTGFLLRAAEAADEDQLPIFSTVLTQMAMKTKDRDLVNLKLSEVGDVSRICASKGNLAKLLVKLPIFRPPPRPPMPTMPMMPGMPAGNQAEGFRYQTESLFGFLLSPTCIDSAMFKERSARQIHFQGLARKTRPAVSQAQSLLRHSLGEVINGCLGCINPLLRTDEASRQAVIGWLGALVTGTEPRTKSANTLDEGGGPNHFIESMDNSPMPMHQNLDMRLQMQAMQARMQGFATPGTAINVFWVLLELCKPIKKTMAASMDPFYICRDSPIDIDCLGGFSKESRMADEEAVEAAKKYAAENDLLKEAPKFTTQIFWVALRAVHVLLVPVLKEEICFAIGAGYFQPKDPNKMEACLGEHFAHETIFDYSNFLSLLGAFLNIEMSFLLASAYPEKVQELGAGTLKSLQIPPTEVSQQWTVLPSCVLDDFVEILEYCISIRPPGQPMSELFTHVDQEQLLTMVIFMLGAGDHIKNPNLRGKATTILTNLMKNPMCSSIIEQSPLMLNSIIPACIRVFTAVEKTKQSYYDIRMQLKYQLRVPIMELFEKMMAIDAHKKVLKSFASEHSDEFLKFLNQMMNDATMQLEEGLDTLTKYRQMEKDGTLPKPQLPGQPAGGASSSGGQPGANQDVNEDEQGADGNDMYRRSRTDPKEHCRTYMKLGNRTIKTLHCVCREASSAIVSKLNVLQQLLQNCLNSCLDRLVGPKCLELKGKSSDFEDFHFHPKDLLRMVCEMYVFTGREDKDKVQKLITEDGRNYKAKTFQKAIKILRREAMIASGMLKDFEAFVAQLNALAAAQEEALANVEIPDQYLDPIMSEIMVDPVMLPTSKTIMDRRVIERHIMSNDDDPFNRMPLKVADLVPETKLKEEIHAFCAQHNISLGED